MLEKLAAATETLGKPEWRAMLRYVAELHARSIRPPQDPLPLPWEEIGPGYCYGPAFGHWDIVHQILDVVHDEPAHARNQLLNNFANQQADGYLPGSIWMRDMSWKKPGEKHWNLDAGHPPVWPVAVDAYVERTADVEMLRTALPAAQRQIAWFDATRRAEGEGYFYSDIFNRRWESGVDEGVRFDDAPTAKAACVDATAHVYLLVSRAAAWADRLGEDATALSLRANELAAFMQHELFSPETGFFHDAWSVRDSARRRMALEGMWPVVVGAATAEQAARVIDDNLLSPHRFFTPHPVSSVGRTDPAFSLRMWRGPSWNSMTLWAALGCARYGRPDAARTLLEKALDASAAAFAATGKVWEFYHPLAGDPRECQRKPHTKFNQPCADYLGHNPLIAMVRLWRDTPSASRA